MHEICLWVKHWMRIEVFAVFKSFDGWWTLNVCKYEIRNSDAGKWSSISETLTDLDVDVLIIAQSKLNYSTIETTMRSFLEKIFFFMRENKILAIKTIRLPSN